MAELQPRAPHAHAAAHDATPRLELRNERLRLVLAPQLGASVLDFSANLGGEWIAILRRAPERTLRPSQAASFLMAPWSNRIRDGLLRFEGRTHQLRFPEKHAIHGDVRARPWRRVRASACEAVLRFDSRDFEDVNFPFPFGAEVCYRLDGDSCWSALRLENPGPAPMPAGFGFHPYFVRALAGREEDVELEMRCDGVYPGETPLPTGPPVALAPEQDFRRLRPLGCGLDHCFAGWQGRALLHWPASRVRLQIEADPPLRHVVLYTPPGEPFFALEPVTHATNGFNALAAGEAGTGVVILGPGEALEAGFRMTLAA